MKRVARYALAIVASPAVGILLVLVLGTAFVIACFERNNDEAA